MCALMSSYFVIVRKITVIDISILKISYLLGRDIRLNYYNFSNWRPVTGCWCDFPPFSCWNCWSIFRKLCTLSLTGLCRGLVSRHSVIVETSVNSQDRSMESVTNRAIVGAVFALVFGYLSVSVFPPKLLIYLFFIHVFILFTSSWF
jgi:hypothetical protein